MPSLPVSPVAVTNRSRITEAESMTDDVSVPKSPAQPQALTTDEATPAANANGATRNGPATLTKPRASSEVRQGRTGRSEAAYQSAYPSRSATHGGKRVASSTGGVQVTLDGSGSWSELARKDATLPTDANTAADAKGEGSSGMFGFLKSKKGRNNSPRPKERGVLGKEGARVVIG